MSIIIMAMPIVFSETHTHTQGEVNKSLFAGNGKQVTLLLSLGSPPLVDRLWRADSRSRASQPVLQAKWLSAQPDRRLILRVS